MYFVECRGTVCEVSLFWGLHVIVQSYIIVSRLLRVMTSYGAAYVYVSHCVGWASLPPWLCLCCTFVCLARYVMRLLSCDWVMRSLDCNQLCVLLWLGLFKQRLSVIRRHLCEERLGSNSGKSCVLCSFVACTCSVLCCQMLICYRIDFMFQILRSFDSCNKWLAAIDLLISFWSPPDAAGDRVRTQTLLIILWLNGLTVNTFVTSRLHIVLFLGKRSKTYDLRILYWN